MGTKITTLQDERRHIWIGILYHTRIDTEIVTYQDGQRDCTISGWA